MLVLHPGISIYCRLGADEAQTAHHASRFRGAFLEEAVG